MLLRFRRRFFPSHRSVSFWSVLISACFTTHLHCFAGEVTLKDGTVLRGTIETPALLRGATEAEVGFVRVDDGVRRILFHTKQLGLVGQDSALDAFKPFRIRQPLSRSLTERIDNVVSIVEIKPFDDAGRRTFSVLEPPRRADEPARRIDIVQGITEVHPEYVKVQALKYQWESVMATAAVPADTLEKVLRSNIDSADVDDRLRLARFFIAAEWYVQAEKELKAIEQEFPQVADQAREASSVLEQLKSRRRLREIKLRRTAGQHRLAYQLVKEFPADSAPGDVLTEVRDIVQAYDAQLDRIELARRELERLRGEAKPEHSEKITGPIQEIVNSLHVENIARLDNFLSASENSELTAEDRLGAAISGWLLGSPFAEANFERAMRIWDARTRIVAYLSEPDSTRRAEILNELKSQELVSVDHAARVIEHLLPLVSFPELATDRPTQLTVLGSDERPIDYWIILPPDYNPFRSYPVIMTLHPMGGTPEQQVQWWSSPPGFQASRHGYIVVAPKYVDDPKQGYRYDIASHDAVLYTLIDVRRRFSVDSDRVFLTGHSMGGHAAWDIGLAHPDLFAGVIPICGSPQFYCEHYWPNAEQTAFYVVEGEKDGQAPEVNMRTLRRMMQNGHDVVYVEYKGRGHENFSDEILRIFDWMSRKTRRKFPLSFSCRSARPTDNEFFWISVDNFDPAVMTDPRVFDRAKVRPAQLEGKITQLANAIQLQLKGPREAELWLSPGMVDLNQPVTVRVNGRIEHRKTVPLDLEALLEDFRIRADRQKLFYAKMSFSRL